MPERPLECSQCKKCADVTYTEIINGDTAVTEMCRDCPILKHKLEGKSPLRSTRKKEEGLFCNYCETSLEAVLMGEPLGCKECYLIFENILVDQLMGAQLLPPKLKPNSKSLPPILHIGKTPFIDKISKDKARIHDLSGALSEAIKRENYEEAAWLRDQIQSLTKAQDDLS